MKYLIASDIHGSAFYCRKLAEVYQREEADRMILLGDILYHGPRNDLPRDYAPREVIGILNAMRSEIYSVRGNCEAEVDQMVLEFPVLADYMLLFEAGHVIFATHGHIFNENHLPPMKPGDILLHGHTHIPCIKRTGEILILNPGSISLPKEGHPHTYAILENGVFQLRDLMQKPGEDLIKEIAL